MWTCGSSAHRPQPTASTSPSLIFWFARLLLNVFPAAGPRPRRVGRRWRWARERGQVSQVWAPAFCVFVHVSSELQAVSGTPPPRHPARSLSKLIFYEFRCVWGGHRDGDLPLGLVRQWWCVRGCPLCLEGVAVFHRVPLFSSHVFARRPRMRRSDPYVPPRTTHLFSGHSAGCRRSLAV